MEPEQRGRASRASSTSSLGREVRCGCQYYQSDSLLPERRALLGRPPSRTTMQQPTVRCSEHEYEPIAPPASTLHLHHPAVAPVVRITDTDVAPVADSDESIDDRSRLRRKLVLEGDIVLPLDGKIEDSAMEGRELVENVDTSEEQELTAQQFQDRVEERFLSTATPGAESRTDGEVNTSQVDSSALEELPLQRGARGLPQRIKTQAGKLRSRLRGIQRPSFVFADRRKSEKSKSTSSGKSEMSRPEKRPSRIERIRSSLPDRPKFSLPDRPKFNIKRPNIKLPSALTRNKKPPSLREQQRQRSTESTVGSKRNIFDFSTYPRIFDKKSKNRGEYATSSPKESRAQSTESATFPRAKKGLPLSARWAQRFGDTAYLDEDRPEAVTIAERTRPWRHPSLEEPRLSIRMEEEVITATRGIPWEETRKSRKQPEEEKEEEIQYMDYEPDSTEIPAKIPLGRTDATTRSAEESYEQEPAQLDPRLYDDQVIADVVFTRGSAEEVSHVQWQDEGAPRRRGGGRKVPRTPSFENEQVSEDRDDRYERTFQPVDPRRFGPESEEDEEQDEEEEAVEDEEEEEEEEQDISSAPSDKEQQHSSGSSCDRRRRGVIEEIDSDEFFLRASGISQDDMTLGKYLADEIRDALRSDTGNSLADDAFMPIPPQRPARTRSLRKRKEGSIESYDVPPPERPKRERARSRRSEDSVDDVSLENRGSSVSRHRIVYQAEVGGPDVPAQEPLDDLVIVKPIRRKSRSSLRSQSQATTESSVFPSSLTVEPSPPPEVTPSPPTVPSRRKRPRRETRADQKDAAEPITCNGHHEWTETSNVAPEKPLPKLPLMESEPATLQLDMVEKSVPPGRESIQAHLKKLEEQDYIEPAPIPPKRKSRSRGTSVAPDEDRTSRGAESLPEMAFEEEELPRDDTDSVMDQPGYAIVEKREKPPRPPPPRRRHKFATTPRPSAPKRPQRAYSTLGPLKMRASTGALDQEPREVSTPYMEIDLDDSEHQDLRSGEVLNKMQGRPLPAPPRPPRPRKQQIPQETRQERAEEVATATQTDPLPDDLVIEEEITQAKLIVAPSRSGSQILVSTERIPSPSGMSTPPVPPLPLTQHLRRDEDETSERAPSSIRGEIYKEEREERSRLEEEDTIQQDDLSTRLVRSALLSDETVRISNLEVRDLRVDRLSVSQLEAHRIAASEIDTMIISATELKSAAESIEASQLPSSLLRELIAIRSHLETVAASQEKEKPLSDKEKVKPSADDTTVGIEGLDIPAKDDRTAQEGTDEQDSTTSLSKSTAEEDGKSERKDERPAERQVLAEKDGRTVSATQPVVPAARSVQDASSLQVLHLDPSLRPEASIEASRVCVPPSETSPDRSPPPENIPILAETPSESPTPLVGDQEDAKSRCRSKSGSRSRSPSPSGRGLTCGARQTASPVRSLPPVISVTPDTPEAVKFADSSEMKPQRAVISYSHESRRSQRERSTPSPPPSYPASEARFIAFPASQVPPEFFSLAASPVQQTQQEPGVMETTQQLLRALRGTGVRAMRYFVNYLASRADGDNSGDKIREVELALCALLLLIAGLLILCFGSPRTVTHYHHWDYFNPPQ